MFTFQQQQKMAQPILQVFGDYFEGIQKNFWFWQVSEGAQVILLVEDGMADFCKNFANMKSVLDALRLMRMVHQIEIFDLIWLDDKISSSSTLSLKILFRFISYKRLQEDKLGPNGDHQDN